MIVENIEYRVVLFDNCYRELFERFNCGNDEINSYLYKAQEYLDEGLGVTKLIIDNKEDKLIGFYSLAATSLLYDTVSIEKAKGLPSVEIKMFAIDLKYQDLQLSEDLEEGILSDEILSLAIHDVYELSYNYLGVKFITLQSTPSAYKFYKRNLFNDLESFMVAMYDRYTEGCIKMYYKL